MVCRVYFLGECIYNLQLQQGNENNGSLNSLQCSLLYWIPPVFSKRTVVRLLYLPVVMVPMVLTNLKVEGYFPVITYTVGRSNVF